MNGLVCFCLVNTIFLQPFHVTLYYNIVFLQCFCCCYFSHHHERTKEKKTDMNDHVLFTCCISSASSCCNNRHKVKTRRGNNSGCFVSHQIFNRKILKVYSTGKWLFVFNNKKNGKEEACVCVKHKGAKKIW